jgi:hypothetical protein
LALILTWGLVVLCWVSDLRNWRGICYLWSWPRWGMVSGGIVVRLVVCWRPDLVAFVCLWRKWQRISWRILVVVGSPLHGVIYFSGWWFLRRLSGVLLHFPLGVEVNGAIFGAVVGFTVVIYVVWGFAVYGPQPRLQPGFEALPL